MAVSKRNRSSKAAARVKRKERRARLAALNSKWLEQNAPPHTYHIDRAFEEVLSAGFVSQVGVAQVRYEVGNAAAMAELMADVAENYRPNMLRKMKRLFNDLKKIQRLIAPHKDLTSSNLLLFTTGSLRGAEFKDLLDALRNTSDAIGWFVANFKPSYNPGNHDPLTRAFLVEMMERWSEWFLGKGPEDEAYERHLFVRLSAAAWRDVGYPTKDEKGQRLEDWLADRVRKQFPDGVRAERVRQLEISTGTEPPWSPEVPPELPPEVPEFPPPKKARQIP